MSVIKINIDKEENMIKIYNNGKGIPIIEHKDEKVFVPTLIFGHLLTSSNYDDDEKKVTGNYQKFELLNVPPCDLMTPIPNNCFPTNL